MLGGNIEGDIAAVQQDESLTDEQKAERIEALRAEDSALSQDLETLTRKLRG